MVNKTDPKKITTIKFKNSIHKENEKAIKYIKNLLGIN
jgi:hypothetical protein